jgi:hypothetical protein
MPSALFLHGYAADERADAPLNYPVFERIARFPILGWNVATFQPIRRTAQPFPEFALVRVRPGIVFYG